MDKQFLRWYISEMFSNEKDIVIVKNEDILCVKVKGDLFHLYIKSLTYAGNPYPINTTRAQLPRRSEFDPIKSSNDIFLFLGYDEKNEVFACWDPDKTKARLNEKEYVSFFSRLNLQETVKKGKINNASLTNGLKYVLFNINDLPSFLLNINKYFNRKIETVKTNPLSNIKPEILCNDIDESILKRFIDSQLNKDENVSMLSLVSKCMNEFGAIYNKMKLSDWQKVITKFVNLDNPPQMSEEHLLPGGKNYKESTSTNNFSIPYSDYLSESFPILDRSGDAWTENEEKLLVNYFKEGLSYYSLAKIFGRPEISIKTRLAKLGLIEYEYGQLDATTSDSIHKKTEVNPIVPPSKEQFKIGTIDVKKLKSVFDNKVTSYKYFWFIAIISLAKERKELSIAYEKILIRMAALAWPLVLDSEINFGERDMLSKYLYDVQRKTRTIKAASSGIVETSISQYYNTMGIKEILSPLLKNVPYRFLSPWVKFTTFEEVINKSKQDGFDGPYALYPDRIVLNSQWWEYIENHYNELYDFTFRSFIDYAKQYNSNLKLLKLMSKGKF